MTTNHPANGPVSLDRLHQISEILSKASAQSDGGNLGYAMADAMKVIDGAIAAFDENPAAEIREDLDRLFVKIIHPSTLKAGDKLYAIPVVPVVPDEYRHLSELYHAQEKRLFKLAQRIKGPSFDKYAHSPSQAIDVLEAAIFGDNEDACRSAMLYGAVPASQAYKLPQTQFKQVADLYEMQFDDGRTCTFHTDAQKAVQWLQACDGNRVQEYVKLERLQNALSGNSPVIGIDLASEPDRSVEVRYLAPPGYVMVPVEPTMAMLDEFDSIIDYGAEDSKDAWRRLIAAAPQQEAE